MVMDGHNDMLLTLQKSALGKVQVELVQVGSELTWMINKDVDMPQLKKQSACGLFSLHPPIAHVFWLLLSAFNFHII
jgi:hypothetical protein